MGTEFMFLLINPTVTWDFGRMDCLMDKAFKYHLVEHTKGTFCKAKNQDSESSNLKMDQFL